MSKANPSNLTSQLSKVIKNKRVRVYIDGGNFYYSTSKNGLRIDFEQIYNYFQTNSNFIGINYYTAYRPDDPDQEKFLDLLSKYKYSLITKPIKNQNGNIKGNMDIELAVDAILQINSYDIFVLFSGDGDFAYLTQKIEQMGKLVVVICVGGFTSFELHTSVGKFFFLDRISSVWKKPTKAKKKTMDEIEQNLPPMIFADNDFFIPVEPALGDITILETKTKTSKNRPRVLLNTKKNVCNEPSFIVAEDLDKNLNQTSKKTELKNKSSETPKLKIINSKTSLKPQSTKINKTKTKTFVNLISTPTISI